MKLLPSGLSEEETKHLANLIELTAEYCNDHIPAESRIAVMQGLVLNTQVAILNTSDYRHAMYIARYIATMKPHPDKSIRVAIDQVLSGKAEKLFATLDKSFNQSVSH